MPDYAVVSEFFIKMGIALLFGTLSMMVSHDLVVTSGIYKKPYGDDIFLGSWMFQLMFVATIIAKWKITMPNSPTYTLIAGIFLGFIFKTCVELQWKFARRWGYV